MEELNKNIKSFVDDGAMQQQPANQLQMPLSNSMSPRRSPPQRAPHPQMHAAIKREASCLPRPQAALTLACI